MRRSDHGDNGDIYAKGLALLVSLLQCWENAGPMMH